MTPWSRVRTNSSSVVPVKPSAFIALMYSGGDAMVARPHQVLERGAAEPLGLDALDVVDGDAVGLRALNVVERELVVALGLQRADVFRADVVDRELIPAPERKVVAVAERLHFRRRRPRAARR